MKQVFNNYLITDEKENIDLNKVTQLLNATYWASGRSKELIKKSIANSLCISVFHNKEQVGFARIVTDYALFAWICDIVIDPEHRGKGIGKKIMEIIETHPDIPKSLQLLKTKDAHKLYKKYGFVVDDCMSKRE